MADAKEMRFEFGKNWHRFVRKNFTQERCDAAKQRLLKFIGRESLAGLDFLDIGCGSGLHSLAAWQAGAGRIHGFDYDANSVTATALVRRHAGNPPSWTVERGDVLDPAYLARLGKWSLVYSWGVLHHTGRMWEAIRNAQGTVADGGLFYIALYSADADFQPSKEFWLDVKQRYNRSNYFQREAMVVWYVWRFMMDRKLAKLPEVVRRAVTYRLQRGMNLFADIRDWLGGWPMEYAPDQAVVDLLEQEHGFRLVNLTTGQACSEFLFERSGTPGERTIVTEMVAAKKAATAAAA